ncbi:fasciclin domain-containing protein [Parasphingorhabdus sp.]|uniref:fasciclin domain-containing protein n=1 Tax=Parasphingorhabdus sp. TaxID=2709688 RepID=UPI0032637FDA
MHILSKVILASAALATISACSSELTEDEQAILDARIAEESKKPTNLTAVIQGNPDLSTASMAVGQSGVAQELKDDGPFTSFIATNAAFDKMEDGKLEALVSAEDKSELAAIAKFGLVKGTMTSADIAKAITDGGGTASLETLQGGSIKASMDGDKIVLEDGAGSKANILEADVESSNGVIHILDTVLMPG